MRRFSDPVRALDLFSDCSDKSLFDSKSQVTRFCSNLKCRRSAWWLSIVKRSMQIFAVTPHNRAMAQTRLEWNERKMQSEKTKSSLRSCLMARSRSLIANSSARFFWAMVSAIKKFLASKVFELMQGMSKVVDVGRSSGKSSDGKVSVCKFFFANLCYR